MAGPACPVRAVLAALVLVTNVAGLRSPDYSLRKNPPSNCGFAEYGSETGSAQRLEETQLSPGVADWNIIVPIPPPCAQVAVTGVRMRVCDDDAPPDVSLTDAQTARVHRTGSLVSAAAVNVTVYCILPPPLPPLYLTDSTSSFEMYSKEPHSNEVISNEDILHDLMESIELTSSELVTPVKLTSRTTLAPAPEETTAQVEHTSPAEVITPPPYNKVHRKEKRPQSLKVTINIAPANPASKKEDTVSQSYDAELPSLSNIKKPSEVMSSQSPTSSSVPHIETRFSGLPPRKYKERPQGLSQPCGTTPPRAPLPPRSPWPTRGMLQPPQYLPALPFAAAPSHPLAPMYRPLRLLGPQLSVLQRQRPLLIFRHF